MDLSQLLQFQKVAELEHMTQAAFALHVAQPALSRTIKSLEKELGLQFFDRENKSLPRACTSMKMGGFCCAMCSR